MKHKIMSRVIRSEVLANRDRKFGADGIYYPAMIHGNSGSFRALFTEEQLQQAIDRASANPEDWPE